MIVTKCLPHDRVEFKDHEVGNFSDLGSLPWVSERIARVAETRIGVEIQIGPYVGRLVIPDRVVIDIEEPFPGTIAACLELSRSGRRAASQGSPPGRVHVPPWVALAEEFTADLAAYVMRGIDKQYVPELIRTSRPRGRLEVGLTATQVLSRGWADKIICRPRVLSDDTPFNRALVAAAARAEQILTRDGSLPSLRALRTLAPALSWVRRDLVPDLVAARIDVIRLREDHRHLLSLAELLVEGVPSLPPGERLDELFPVTAWLNVERIFEEAIFWVAREVVGSRGQVHVGKGDGTRLFAGHEVGDPETLAKSADPDIVVECSGGTILLDAKYRRHRGEFTEDELYQLIAHAGAYRAKAAALVAPVRAGGTPEVRWLGRDRRGTAYSVISVNPTDAGEIFGSLEAWLGKEITQL